MHEITKEDVLHISELSNLNVDGEEEKFSELLSDTLNYIKVLDQLDTIDVIPTFQVSGLKNIFQDDNSQKATLSKKEAMSNAKEVVDGLFTADAVFER